MDPVTLGSVLLAVITGTSEALSGQLWAEVVSLVRRPMRHRAAEGGQSAVASGKAELLGLQQAPADQQKAVALARALLARSRTDPHFQQALEDWWSQAEPVLTNIRNVNNTISGGIQHGPVLQGRDFSNITFGTSLPPLPSPDLECRNDR